MISLDSDRISGLPDEILCHILSFLPTKISVSTSIFSRRWKFLWAYVPSLSFECGEKEDIIDKVFMLRKVENIHTFRLTQDVDCTDHQMEAWMTSATAHNLQNLELPYLFSVVVPRCVFTCKTLVDLRLQNCEALIPIGNGICLPRLKTLHLIKFHFEDDDTLQHLISGCPVLDELVICIGPFSWVPESCNLLTVKRLTVHLEFCIFSALLMSDLRLKLNAPALEYLQIIASFHEDRGSKLLLTSSCEANIYLHKDEKKQFDLVYQKSVLEFITWLGLLTFECRRIRLSYRTEIMDSELDSWTMSFPNSTELELNVDCRFLSKFLENADNLRVLIFSESSEVKRDWIEPIKVPTCLLSHLKAIKLLNIVDERNIFEVVRYVLKNARVLKKIEISYPKSFDSNQKIRMVHEISLFERASKACQVTFVEVVKGLHTFIPLKELANNQGIRMVL
ncbi:hypothetical protein ABFS83_07G004800 [Erythranthe nasuta]